MFHFKSFSSSYKNKNLEILFNFRECNPGCVNGSLVKGKIVICQSFKNYPEVRKAGAAGSVLLNNEFDRVSFVVSLPAVAVSQDSLSSLISYKESTKYIFYILRKMLLFHFIFFQKIIHSLYLDYRTPVAEILKTEAVKDFDAPVVVGFSSRGPNAIVPEILKVYIVLKLSVVTYVNTIMNYTDLMLKNHFSKTLVTLE